VATTASLLPAGATFCEAATAVLEFLDRDHPGTWVITRAVEHQHEVVAATGSGCTLRPGDRLPPFAGLGSGTATAWVPLQDANGDVLGGLGRRPSAETDAGEALRGLLDLLAQLLSVVLAADRARDATARRSEVLRLQANSDELTGLPNRRGWASVLELEEARYAESGGGGWVIAIDLDRLKVVNDEQGHVAGDEHLQLAGFTLAAALRESDFVARVGGDEFGVLVGGPTTEAEIQHLIRRIRNAFAAAGVGASIGHAAYSRDGGLNRTWWRADQEMYREKRRHREVLDLRPSAPARSQPMSSAG
jgi:diguanylate cyclase (GGDEF)-like protein